MSYDCGDQVGDYEVLCVLGVGGMGTVYKVRNVLSGRTEAMKMLLPGRRNDEITSRFVRELRIQATLDHPNIAGLRTGQRVDGELFMIMEYVEGTTLEAHLLKGPISTGKAINYTVQLLDALEYAHSLAIVHRDIKPSNIMISASGVVKLMDFGVAKLSTDEQLTVAGTIIGSLHYMSPEQIRGTRVDARADLYGLGVCLYEMVTGRRPFIGDSEYAIILAQLNDAATRPTDLNPRLSNELNTIIARALAKSPEHRFQSASEFRAALKGVSVGSMACTKTVDTVFHLSNGARVAKRACPGNYSLVHILSGPDRLRLLSYVALGFGGATMILTMATSIWVTVIR